MGNLDLGLIGNCSIGALVDKRAKIVWCCLPRYDGDPVFHQLMEAQAATRTTARSPLSYQTSKPQINFMSAIPQF